MIFMNDYPFLFYSMPERGIVVLGNRLSLELHDEAPFLSVDEARV